MLKVTEIGFSYGNRNNLFSDISFQVEKSEVLRIKGVNGKGKSTLLKCLLGLLSLDSGDVLLEGQSELDYFRKNTEYLSPEANALFDDMSACENIESWLSLRSLKIDRDSIKDALQLWGFSGDYLLEKMPVSQFSTGMKRRLAMARVSLSSTKLWLLDEPLYGLDKQGVEQFQELLVKHTSNGGAAIIISHDESIFRDNKAFTYKELEL